MIIVLMGVAGAGKTTIGHRLAASLGWPFYDADAYHPPDNVEKVQHHVPLTDRDRLPWLETLHALVARLAAENRSAILACSALRRTYRSMLAADAPVPFVYLRVPPAIAAERLAARRDHFMPAELVPSQYATLEEPSPSEAVIVDATQPPDQIVADIRRRLGIDAG